jgi:hypothetical protein
VSDETPVSLRAMLDSNAFDKLLVIDDAIDVLNDLASRGRLVILTTHVQRDELAETPEPREPDTGSAIGDLLDYAGTVIGFAVERPTRRTEHAPNPNQMAFAG